MDSRLLRKRKFFIHIVSTIHLSRHARCSVCPHWYFFRNYSRLRVSENKRKTCFPFVECEQSQLEIKAIMQEKNDERSKSRVKLAWAMPRKEEVEYYSTDYEGSNLFACRSTLSLGLSKNQRDASNRLYRFARRRTCYR